MNTNRIIIEGDIILKTVEKIKVIFLSVPAKENDHVEIEFQNITKWDVAGIQLLYAFQQYLSLKRITFSYQFNDPEQAEKCQEWLNILNKN